MCQFYYCHTLTTKEYNLLYNKYNNTDNDDKRTTLQKFPKVGSNDTETRSTSCQQSRKIS